MEKIKTQFDIAEMLKIYSDNDNYEVMHLRPDSNLCVIYFSGNGLYYPNTDTTFHKVVSEGNRYEWKKNILQSAHKVIFVRDVKKQWYLEGINQHIDSIEKLHELLINESKGLDVICVGNSAGGYIATLMGCLMGASHVFCFSGQFSLFSSIREESDRQLNPILVKYEDSYSHKKYYSLINLIQHSQVPIFYFYPAKCTSDIEQFNLIKTFSNVYSFAFKKDRHGETCYSINYLDLFAMNLNSLFRLHSSLAGKELDQHFFSKKVSGYYKTFVFIAFRRIKNIKTLLKKP